MQVYRYARGEAGFMKDACGRAGGGNVVESERIELRRTTERDLDFVLKLERDPGNAPNLAYWSREEHAATLRETRWAHLIVAERGTGERLGYVIVTGLRDESHNVQLKRIVIAEQRHGWGRETLRLLKKWVFESLHAHRFWADVKTFNEGTKHLYESEGMHLEGMLRECVKCGPEYHSVEVWSILEPEYRASQQA